MGTITQGTVTGTVRTDMIGTFPKGTYIDIVLMDITGIMNRGIFLFTSTVRIEIIHIGTVMEDTVRSPWDDAC
jgi:hypothetical protein